MRQMKLTKTRLIGVEMRPQQKRRKAQQNVTQKHGKHRLTQKKHTMTFTLKPHAQTATCSFE